MAGQDSDARSKRPSNAVTAAETGDPTPARPTHPSRTARLTASGDRLLTRAPAAEAIGVSESTFRRRFENVVLKPIKDGGVHCFVESQVLEVAVRYREERRRSHNDNDNGQDDRGKLAARVFTAFDDGVSPVEVVKRFEIDPDVVEALRAKWGRLRGGFVVGPEEARELDFIVRRLEGPATSAKELVAWLRELEADRHRLSKTAAAKCAKCRRGEREVCGACHRDNLEAEKTRRAELVAQAKTDQEYFRQLQGYGSTTRAKPSAGFVPSPIKPKIEPTSRTLSTQINPEWFSPDYKFDEE